MSVESEQRFAVVCSLAADSEEILKKASVYVETDDGAEGFRWDFLGRHHVDHDEWSSCPVWRMEGLHGCSFDQERRCLHFRAGRGETDASSCSYMN